MLKNILAAVRIGGASVDAVLDTMEVVPGGTLRGQVRLNGGKVDQEIRGIELSIETEYIEEHNDVKLRHGYALGRSRLPESLRIEAGEAREIPFDIPIPWNAPLTLGGQETWLRTRLDIEMAVDAKDLDALRVRPTPLQQRLLDALGALGFSIYNARCEKSRLGRGVPFVQEIEMKPLQGAFRSRLDEIDVVMWAERGRLEVLLEVDRRARGLRSFFAEALDLDESRLVLRFEERDLQRDVRGWAEQISQAIARHA